MNRRIQQKSYGREKFLLSLAFILCLSSPKSYAAIQGKPGKTSTGSFTITLVIHPTLNASSGPDTQDLPDTLSINQPSDFCVSGRGISQYSLTAARQNGNSQLNSAYTLELQTHSDVRVPVLQTGSEKVQVARNCQDMASRLLINTEEGLMSDTRLSGAIGLTIHAE